MDNHLRFSCRILIDLFTKSTRLHVTIRFENMHRTVATASKKPNIYINNFLIHSNVIFDRFSKRFQIYHWDGGKCFTERCENTLVSCPSQRFKYEIFCISMMYLWWYLLPVNERHSCGPLNQAGNSHRSVGGDVRSVIIREPTYFQWWFQTNQLYHILMINILFIQIN